MSQIQSNNDRTTDELLYRSERSHSPRDYGSLRRQSSESNETRSSAPFDDMKSTLSFLQKFGFGLGHVYNDLCAGIWFSYTLLFMQSVLGISAPEAGALVMLGQISDAISTPIVGLLADRYGTKRKWHIIGTGLVFISFPMIFSLCPWCTTMPIWWPPVYFSIFIIIFQFAWAVVQITHFAMIPELSKTTKDRADLTATRYSASICSNLIVYIIMWIVLQGRSNSMNNNIGPSDAYRFRDVSLILTLVGVSMSVIFHFSLALSDYEQRRLLSLAAAQTNRIGRKDASVEQKDRNTKIIESETSSRFATSSETDRLINSDYASIESSADLENSSDVIPIRRHKNFLKMPLLYQNAFLYVFARLFMTTSLVYMPLWLDEQTLTRSPNGFGKDSSSVDHLATVPLVSFLASFLASMILKHLNRLMGHETAYFFGSLVSLIGCFWIALATPAIAKTAKLFTIAILFGSGSSVTMISSLCITADMIGNHTYQGGFIYSAVTFADKLITGIVVMTIEALKCKSRSDCPEYYRSVLAYACGVSAILGILTLATLQCNRAGRRQTAR